MSQRVTLHFCLGCSIDGKHGGIVAQTPQSGGYHLPSVERMTVVCLTEKGQFATGLHAIVHLSIGGRFEGQSLCTIEVAVILQLFKRCGCMLRAVDKVIGMFFHLGQTVLNELRHRQDFFIMPRFSQHGNLSLAGQDIRKNRIEIGMTLQLLDGIVYLGHTLGLLSQVGHSHTDVGLCTQSLTLFTQTA